MIAERGGADQGALLAWANDRTVASLKAARPVMPTGLRDRAEDVLEPLFAIADMAGGEWPDRARRAAVSLMGSTPDQDINVELLHDIAGVFGQTPFLKSGDLLKKLTELEERPWADWKHGRPITARAVADRLKAFGIVPTKNEHDDRGYFRDRFEDAWARYPSIKPSNRQNTNENEHEPPFSNRRDEVVFDGSKTQGPPVTTDLFDGSTLRHLEDGAPGGDEGLPADFVPPMGISRSAWLRRQVHQEKPS